MRNIKNPYHNPNSLEYFEYIDCPLCGSEKYNNVYCRKQYINDEIGDVEITNVICEACGFMFMNPRLKKEVLKGHYFKNSSGDVYHEFHKDSRHGKLNNERKTFIECCLRKLKVGNFLDIGCGQAELLSVLDLGFWLKHGLEPSDARFRLLVDNIQIFPVSIEGFEPEIKYDAISCCSTLEHFINPKKCLTQMSRFLKQKGYLFVEVPDSAKPQAQIAEFFSFEHLSHFTKRTLSLMLTRCGFSDIIFDADSNVSVNAIRCMAIYNGVAELRKNNLSHMDNVNELVPVIEKYKNERKMLLSRIGEIIKPELDECRRQHKKIAVYGAGAHTRFLLDAFDISDVIDCLIDSDPKKAFTKFRNWSVYPPQDIKKLAIDAILISSHNYEGEIFRTIRKYDKSIKILRCYEK